MTEKHVDFALLARSGAETHTAKAGDTIFAEGDPGDRMFVVRSGEVEIFKSGRVVETIGTGGMFGEMALIDGSDRSATARAKSDCELVPVDQKTFLVLVHEMPYFALNVMRMLANRLRIMNELI